MTASERPVAIVTGGGAGVGSATARALAERGFNLAINYRSSEGEAETTAAACRAAGAEAAILRGDVSQDDDCRRMAARADEIWGRIDVLINNAGSTMFASLTDLEAQSAEDFQRIYGVNVIGTYQMTRAAAPWLKASGHGAVVNTSSMSATNGTGSSIAYAASKGALNTLTMSLAKALAPEVRVNAILPGMIATQWFAKGIGETKAAALRERAESRSALGAVCSAEDVAAGIVYLALDAKKMTGVMMEMDAGAALGR